MRCTGFSPSCAAQSTTSVNSLSNQIIVPCAIHSDTPPCQAIRVCCFLVMILEHPALLGKPTLCDTSPQIWTELQPFQSLLIGKVVKFRLQGVHNVVSWAGVPVTAGMKLRPQDCHMKRLEMKRNNYTSIVTFTCICRRINCAIIFQEYVKQ